MNPRSYLVLLLGVFFLVGLMGCGDLLDIDDALDENLAPTAHAGGNQEVEIGETVVLDGSLSNDPDGDNLTYQWELANRPGGSTATLQDPNAEQTSFVADKRGSYVARLVVSDGDDDDADEASITVEIPKLGDISSNTTLANIIEDPAEADYLLEGVADIRAQLTIEPGVNILCASGSRLDVETGGTIVSVGTETDSIKFIGENPSHGYWDGINIGSASASNEFGYTAIRYAGSGGYAGIYVHSTGQVKIHNTLLGSSSTYGITAQNGARLPGFAANVFRNNTQAAVQIPSNLIGSLDTNSDYLGDGTGFVSVSSRDVITTQTWPAINAPYRIDGTTDIMAEVTIQAGAVLEFTQNSRMDVETGGSLIAVGTATDSIIFSGVQPTSGFWDGLAISSNNPNNELKFVKVMHGGSGGYANLYLYSPGQVKISNSTYAESSTTGIYAQNDVRIGVFSGNSFQGNAEAALKIPSGLLGSLDSGSDYLGPDGMGTISVFGRDVTTAQTWPATNAPVVMDGVTDIMSGVTIEPGAEFHFTQGARLDVESSGSITAVGAADDSIRFRGVQKASGYWDGISVHSNSADNQFIYCVIGYGGYSGYANIYVNAPGSIELRNSHLHHSSTYGLDVRNNASVTPADPVNDGNNRFSDNAQGDVNLPN